MDPRDRPELIDGECAACGRPVPADATRVLARREDLAFLELGCLACGSVSLAIRLGSPGVNDVPDRGPASRSGPSIGADDVLDMHVFLASYGGDLRGLVGRSGAPTRPDATGAA